MAPILSPGAVRQSSDRSTMSPGRASRMPEPPRFDPLRYKATVRDQWQNAAEAWHRWIPVVRRWAGPVTDLMLDLVEVRPGQRVLDVAAGDGDQSLVAAERVGPTGYVLATDIAPNL